MEKICLVEAGNYFLGIDAAVITRKQDVYSFLDEEWAEESTPISLASFLDQHSPVPPLAESIIMELDTINEPLTLLVDRIVGEIASPVRFESLPLLYPHLASRCCPQIVVHESQPVLLLDVEGLNEVRAKLESDCGVISLVSLRDSVSMEDSGEFQDTPGLENSLNRASMEDSVEFEDIPKPEKGTEKNDNLPASQLSDIVFKTIVLWTIEEYIKRGSKESCTISFDELPLEYTDSQLLQGVDDDLLRNLIDKIVQKCANTNDDTLHRLRKKAMV